MKIIDCTSFYNEHMMYEVRLNVLKDKVDKFIVTESTYSHSGKKKKLNFDINNYPKFKDKIKYIELLEIFKIEKNLVPLTEYFKDLLINRYEETINSLVSINCIFFSLHKSV